MKIKPKVGVVSCSGECCSLGTLSRVATRLVLEEYRPDVTVTICLPLFLAGELEEHGFAKEHPTISVDGCEKACALKAITKYSNEPADSVVVEDILEQWGIQAPASRRELDGDGVEAARRLAQEISRRIDGIRGE